MKTKHKRILISIGIIVFEAVLTIILKEILRLIDIIERILIIYIIVLLFTIFMLWLYWSIYDKYKEMNRNVIDHTDKLKKYDDEYKKILSKLYNIILDIDDNAIRLQTITEILIESKNDKFNCELLRGRIGEKRFKNLTSFYKQEELLNSLKTDMELKNMGVSEDKIPEIHLLSLSKMHYHGLRGALYYEQIKEIENELKRLNT